MNDPTGMTRRSFVAFAVSAAALGSGQPGAAATGLAPTARQTPGPFYPRTQPLDADADADLVHVAGRAEPATGTVTRIAGRVLDPRGRAVPDALVEIWQCDALGRYHHPRDGGGLDPNFQGYGRTQTDEGGGYRFRTIRPVPYPGRTPHIHFAIAAPNFPRLTTQMYVAGEPGNERDFILGRIRDPRARASVIVPLAPDPDGGPGALAGTFDIVLGGMG